MIVTPQRLPRGFPRLRQPLARLPSLGHVLTAMSGHRPRSKRPWTPLRPHPPPRRFVEHRRGHAVLFKHNVARIEEVARYARFLSIQSTRAVLPLSTSKITM